MPPKWDIRILYSPRCESICAYLRLHRHLSIRPVSSLKANCQAYWAIAVHQSQSKRNSSSFPAVRKCSLLQQKTVHLSTQCSSKAATCQALPIPRPQNLLQYVFVQDTYYGSLNIVSDDPKVENKLNTIRSFSTFPTYCSQRPSSAARLARLPGTFGPDLLADPNQHIVHDPNQGLVKCPQIFQGDVQNPQEGTFTNPCQFWVCLLNSL